MATLPRARRHRILLSAGLVLLALIVVLAVCEWRGWPFLRRPAEQWFSQKLDRAVSFEGSSASRWKLKLLGGIRLEAEALQVGAPSWGVLGPTLVASEARVALRYRDLLAVRKGEPLVVREIDAGSLALRVERLQDGRASWQFGTGTAPADQAEGERPAFDGVRIEQLQVHQGTAIVDDKLGRLSAVARFALREGTALDPSTGKAGLQAKAEGRFRDLPLNASLETGSALPWLSADAKAPAVPVHLRLELGRAGLKFDGQVRDLLASQGLSGKYQLRGPSLAAIGEVLGLTLPTTHAFALQGSLNRAGPRWSTAVTEATIGRSKLAGDFVYDTAAGKVPLLTGELRGPELWLADLGPAIGTPTEEQPRGPRTPGRVLPDRNFDLPSLRAMDADVQIRLAKLESGSAQLQAVKPLSAHLVLRDGVLLIDALDARLAQGRIAGSIRLDGRQPVALWDTQLRMAGLKLEQWVTQARANGAPPYVTGRLGGRIDLKGRGRSTAELLGSADGRAMLYWTHGTISHLVVEGAGLDLAQALGVLVTGDNSLPVNCGVGDLQVSKGIVEPQLMLIDTPDSTIRAEGKISLVTERLSMVARVLPKDISPLTLRTPLKIGGTMGDPSFSLEKAPLLQRLVPAAVLASLNPLAGLIPLIDLGDKESRTALLDCRSAVERGIKKNGM